jgi:hypothetical protein
MNFRKKPVVIQAIQFEYSDKGYKKIMEFCGKNVGSWGKDRHPDAKGWIQIITLEDGDILTAQVKHIATEGDWIIKGVQGEFYPCKPDIFEQTYEPA